MDRWICPTDRQLALRAKLGTGWSVFTNKPLNEHEQSISDEELQHIYMVLKRKEMCDKIEKERIGHMVVHLQNIKRNKSQCHKRECHICGHTVIVISASLSKKVCRICGKTTCENCISQLSTEPTSPNSSESLNIPSTMLERISIFFESRNNGMRTRITICKYCFETREIWKRSGAWKIQQLPEFFLPTTTTNVCPNPDACSKVILNTQSTNIDSASWETYRRPPKWTTLKENRECDQSFDECNSNCEQVFERFSFNPFEEEFKDKNTKCIEPPVECCSHSLAQTSWNSMEEKHKEEGEGEGKFYHQNPPVGSAFWSQDSLAKERKKTKEDNLGILNYKIYHDSALFQLIITINNGKDLKSMDMNGLSDPYVKCHLLPGKTHKTKLRTKTCYRTLNPIWNENLIYHGISRADMDNKTLRLAVLDEDTIGFDWIGEYRLFLPDLNSDEEYNFSHHLLPRQSVSKEFDDLVDHERGKILISLLYHDTTSTLHVTIIRCTELAPMDCNGFSDPFCKIYLKPDKIRITKRKTQTKKMTLNPYFNEEFIIELDPEWVKEKTLEISVWDYDRGPTNDFIGVVKFHYRAKGDRGKLWRAIHDNPNKKFEGWFILCADLSEID